MYSFQVVTNANTDVATRPGATSGSRMRTNAPSRLEPSTIAASSSSRGDADDEAAQRPDGERQHERHVGEDHAGERVRQVVAGEHDVERDDQAGLRQHQDPDHQDDEELAAREAVLGERDRREEREHDRGGTVTITMMRLFLTSSQKYGRCHRIAEVDSVGWKENQVGVQAVDLGVGLERRRDHPEDGEDHDHEDEQPERVPARPAAAPAARRCDGDARRGRVADSAASR